MTEVMTETDVDLHILEKMTRDLKQSSYSLSTREARYLVDTYYQFQGDRMRASAQQRALKGSDEPHSVIAWFARQSHMLEKQIGVALDVYSERHPVGKWARAQKGIGPVIAAGLLAHIDVTGRNTAGAVWRFAGLDPTLKWEKGQKRPFNAKLKTLCWKAGESFVKVSGYEDAYYGQVYRQRKEYEANRNELKMYEDQARKMVGRVGKDTEAFKHYQLGKLPPGHIHARAKRYAVKLFLAHYHHVAFKHRYGHNPPRPYAIEHLGHAKYLAPPHEDVFDEAMQAEAA